MRLRYAWQVLVLCVLSVRTCAAQAGEPAPPRPTLIRVDPNTAPIAGGTEIALIGKNFDTRETAQVMVRVGDQPCEEVRVRSETRITARVPKSPGAGAVNVELRYGDQTVAELPDALCYDDGEISLAKWYRIKARAESTWLLLKQGGSIMLLLAALSLFGVAWAVHCVFVIRAAQILPKRFVEQLSGHISRGEIKPAIDQCQKDGCVFGRIALAALRKAEEAPPKVREAAQAAGSREASHLMQKISYLSNIGVISPMLGLLGTVLGMILAFKTIGMGEAGGKHILLAGAIHKAMITTAAGLTIGIPAMACFYYFRGKLMGIVAEVEQVTEELSEAVSAAGEGA